MSFLPLLLLLLFLLAILTYHRQKKLILQIQEMSLKEKQALLLQWLKPSCLSYLPKHDTFTYTANAAPHSFRPDTPNNISRFPSLSDSLSVYFDYRGKTWLLHLEKGQYGIYFGGDAGLYYTDHIVSPDSRNFTQFTNVKESENLLLSLELLEHNMSVFHLSRQHWYLSGFRIGICHPDELLPLRISVTFPDTLMLQSFIHGLLNAGYSECEIMIRGLTVSFLFQSGKSSCHCRTQFQQLRQHMKLCQSNGLYQLYFFLTQPFESTLDKLVYLHASLPHTFRLLCYLKK